MLRSSLGSQSQASGYKFREQISLLQLKDQQIRRLQNELEQQKRRADAAVKMLQNYKSIQQKYEEGGETLRSQINRRLKVQEEMKKLQQRNAYLQDGIKKYIEMLSQSKTTEEKESFSKLYFEERQ